MRVVSPKVLSRHLHDSGSIQRDPGAVLSAVRFAIAGLDLTLPVYDMQLLDDRLAAQGHSQPGYDE